MGPIPGKNPKNVGERLALNCRRLPCCTHCPPVNWLRIRKLAWDVWFTIEMPGWSFHVPEKSDGRLMRSEEHTSELQSLAYLVCRLLLENKKIITRVGRQC